MLLVPITGKISWRNPPIITIGLILVNCLVYFVIQGSEMQRLYEAEDFYFSSGLAEIEIPYYMKYLSDEPSEESERLSLADLDKDTLVRYHRKMERDYDFLEALRNDEIISPNDPHYESWKELRDAYDQALTKVVFIHYGFRPAYPKPISFLTHMFLHGSVGHLIGNMLFLWILGVSLELGCGRAIYSLVYVAGGLFAVTLFWLIYSKSTIPLVGASGAIAGLMGAFTVLYGKKKVNLFFSTGFYFNYVKIPAIVLLPLWIGNELFQLFFGGVSHVAYVAHIGGLLGGAILGYINLKVLGFYDANIFEEAPTDDISPQIERALAFATELKYDNARAELKKVLIKDPGNIAAMTHMYNIERHDPESPRYHQAAKNLLVLLCRVSDHTRTAYQIYADYLKRTKIPRLPPQLYLQMSTICSGSGDPQNAQKILSLLLKKKSDLPGMPEALLKLGQSYRKKGMKDNWQKCLRVIHTQYPDTVEAQIAKKELTG